jgi:outer membrane protein TolC
LRGVLQEQLRLYNALLTLVQVQGDRLAQRVNLHLALGGGFEDEAANTAGESGATPAPAGPSSSVPAS